MMAAIAIEPKRSSYGCEYEIEDAVNEPFSYCQDNLWTGFLGIGRIDPIDTWLFHFEGRDRLTGAAAH
ncbi:MAG: hypothetical protein MZW92_27995 [Comamonadaceae bacterium]|nr:hypothetical protein [Comamonadaceae bacterium]